MLPERDTRLLRALAPAMAALALAVLMTWPLAPKLGSVGRTGVAASGDPYFGVNGDGMFCLWNVSWVARTIVADPLQLFDANIFHPHRNSLAYSEANIVAGVLGAPAWWLTRNPYATLNSVILFAFASAWLCTWLLVRRLTGDNTAASAAGIFVAFCPYVFAHTAHIQLMLTGGIPLSMLMLHRLVDAPSLRRGAALGAALFVQALACAYYGIYAGLMVGFGVVFFTISRGLLRNAAWWKGVAIAATTSIAAVVPFFLPYLALQQEQGFARALQESSRYSANAASYLASSAYAHGWLLELIAGWPRWNEVMFPGILPVALGLAGIAMAAAAVRSESLPRERETALLYGLLGALTFWASFGPAGGLYNVLFRIPVFSFLRAPSRMAIVVVICLAVLAALALQRLLARSGRWRRWASVAVVVAALAELTTAMPWERAIELPEPYHTLATLPRAPMAEFPFYGGRPAWHLHTQYMLFSTSHWTPMMNGYSDHTPQQFRSDSVVLDGFPSTDAFDVLRKARVRYIGVHWDMFGPRSGEIRQRLQPFMRHLRPLAASARMTLYEIISFP